MDQGVGNEAREIRAFRDVEDSICDLDCPLVVIDKQIGPGELAPDRGRFGAEVAEEMHRGAEECKRVCATERRKERPAECRGGAGRRQSVAHGPVTLDRPPQMRFSGVRGRQRRLPRQHAR